MKTKPRYVLRYISDIPLLICTTVPVNDCWMFELNEIGALIWKQFEKKIEIGDVIKSLECEMKHKMSEKQKRVVEYYCEKLEELGVIKNGIWV